ncbi:hypothetical protein GCM10008956_32450 [Deinococcus arenae]|uniref:HipA-like kinase domain-containing protein n=1 Tax=Deinococcus arenae TaxID=1452751 RepID=A0A8H9L7J6_9DEIO|nr:HipA family kinase [Deinococcus arenae]GGM54076.1 hypothetical protein GCM10008956_32450 [Deinococcus arenae]
MTQQLLMPSKRRLTASIWQGVKLPGSAKAQLIVDSSSMPLPWVVKSLHSGQGQNQGLVPGDQAAFNDYVGSRLAEAAGFSVGEVAIMTIDDEFLDGYPELRMPQFGGFAPGEHFAVKYYPGSQTLDHFNTPLLRAALRAKCVNPHVANQVVAFDSALVNWDRSIPMQGLGGENPGNLLFRPGGNGVGVEMVMIDQGYCFGAKWDTQTPAQYPHSIGAWPDEVFGVFKALALINFYDHSDVLNMLGRLQRLTVANVNSIIQEVPASWLGFTDSQQLAQLVAALTARIANYARIVNAHYSSVHAHALVKV